MSSQTPQKVRLMNSPSTRHSGPMKAMVPFSLLHGSPTRNLSIRKNSPSTSPIHFWTAEQRSRQRRSPDNRSSPDRTSQPGSPVFKVEKPKPIRPYQLKKSSGCAESIAGHYLASHWPKNECIYVPSVSQTCDKSTQTQEESDDLLTVRKSCHFLSNPMNNGETLNKEVIRQRLAKTKESSKIYTSPIQGKHSAIQCLTTGGQSKPISIPISYSQKHIPPNRGSLESLNQEIEKLVIKNTNFEYRESIPDGHRAPVFELLSNSSTRSVDTQTPRPSSDSSSQTPIGELLDHLSGSKSRPTSAGFASPAKIFSPGLKLDSGDHENIELSSRSNYSSSDEVFLEESNDEKNSSPKSSDDKLSSPESRDDRSCSPISSDDKSCSPSSKSFIFVREPPDGCEKIVTSEENGLKRENNEKYFCPIQKFTDCHIPSVDSAFCPLLTKCVINSSDCFDEPLILFDNSSNMCANKAQ